MNRELIENNLRVIFLEIKSQPQIGNSFPPEIQSLPEQLLQIQEYIEEAGEYGVAYECIVALLEQNPFVLNGPTAVFLLEIGLLLGYKTMRMQDMEFNVRR